MTASGRRRGGGNWANGTHHGRKAAGERSPESLVENVCNYIRTHPSSDVSLSGLEREFGVDRYTLHRTFRSVMGVTPRKYVEECRIQLVKRKLRVGETGTVAVYSSGYNSPSWLYGSGGSKLGMSPATYRRGGEGARIFYETAACPLGMLLVAMTGYGICSVSMADTDEQLVSFLGREYPKAEISRSDVARQNLESVQAFFKGQLASLPLDIDGTAFQRRVWASIMAIPFGSTVTYSELACRIGRPGAHRAVANACASNPVPLVVPCHRVVRKDGGMGGYALGSERKELLLRMESSGDGSSQLHRRPTE